MPQPNDRSPLLNRVREVIRTKHYGIRAGQSYVGWVNRFSLFHGKHYPQELGEFEVGRFLPYPAIACL
jgi:hypothetical protein